MNAFLWIAPAIVITESALSDQNEKFLLPMTSASSLTAALSRYSSHRLSLAETVARLKVQTLISLACLCKQKA